MRTLLHIFSTFRVGGPQVRTAAIVNHLGRKYRHLIAAMDGATAATALLDPDTDYEIIQLGATKTSLVGNVLAFRRILRSRRPDLLLTYNWGAIDWAIANFLPLSAHVHVEDGFGPEEAGGQLRRRVLTRRLVLARCERGVMPSQTLHDIATRIWRLDPALLDYVPNGIDCARFARPPDAAIVERYLPRGDLATIGTVAVLRPEKNLSRLIRAFARVNETVPARLVLVGDGAERAKLEGLARDLGLAERVVFTGHLQGPERILGALDLFAMSSETEQMPYGVIEAMAAGLAVASVDVGDVANMVAAENRPYIVDRDEISLAEAMIALLGDRARRVAVGRANRVRAETEFDESRMFAAWDALFSLNRRAAGTDA